MDRTASNGCIKIGGGDREAAVRDLNHRLAIRIPGSREISEQEELNYTSDSTSMIK